MTGYTYVCMYTYIDASLKLAGSEIRIIRGRIIRSRIHTIRIQLEQLFSYTLCRIYPVISKYQQKLNVI